MVGSEVGIRGCDDYFRGSSVGIGGSVHDGSRRRISWFRALVCIEYNRVFGMSLLPPYSCQFIEFTPTRIGSYGR